MPRGQDIWRNLAIRGAARMWAGLIGGVTSLALLPVGPVTEAQAQQREIATAQAQVLATRVPRPTDENQLLALVIGNADYAETPLRNPVNDARGIGEALTNLGFDAITLDNANQSEMMDAISSFRDALANGGTAVFYYAGHGVQLEHDNFLVPVNHGIESEAGIRDRAVPLDSVLSAMSRTGGTNIVILDACRNNPFGSAYSVPDSGLARPLNAPPGTLIAYASQPNRTASDGAGDHGTYTAAILRNLEAPISVTDMFQKVRTEVAEETGDYQVPWTVDILKLDARTRSTFSFASVPARHETEALRTIAAALGLEENTVWQTRAERDGAGRVTAIDLSGLGSSGEIPRAIGNLLHLERLDLSRNNLVGGIPVELGTLAQLTSIDLSENRLMGRIPAELGNLSELKSLRLMSTGLIGEIPVELKRLSHLEVLNLAGNRLTGTIPAELGSLSQLKTLNLWANELAGSIPAELGDLSQLTIFEPLGQSTDGCDPAGTRQPVPACYVGPRKQSTNGCDPAGTRQPVPARGTAAQPTFLRRPGGTYGGDPAGARQPVPAHYVGPRRQSTNGCDPAGTRQPCPSSRRCGSPDSHSRPTTRGDLQGRSRRNSANLSKLTMLHLGGNQLTGAIPPELGNLSKLTMLHLGGNQLTGAIPPELGNLSQLEALRLNRLFSDDQGGLTGEIPPELGNLSQLTTLDLEGNQLTGAIPPELGNLSQLTMLDLGGNQLTGAIPPELGNLSQLTTLDLEGNQLTGAIPPELGNLSELAMVDLGDNQLTGAIPPELSQLKALDVWGNALIGSEQGVTADTDWAALEAIADAFGIELHQLMNGVQAYRGRVVELILRDRRILGRIPKEIGDLSGLEVLVLANSGLTGPIPAELGKLSSLEELDLTGNQLTGPIPVRDRPPFETGFLVPDQEQANGYHSL